jgi:hypothetical protein
MPGKDVHPEGSGIVHARSRDEDGWPHEALRATHCVWGVSQF